MLTSCRVALVYELQNRHWLSKRSWKDAQDDVWVMLALDDESRSAREKNLTDIQPMHIALSCHPSIYKFIARLFTFSMEIFIGLVKVRCL